MGLLRNLFFVLGVFVFRELHIGCSSGGHILFRLLRRLASRLLKCLTHPTDVTSSVNVARARIVGGPVASMVENRLSRPLFTENRALRCGGVAWKSLPTGRVRPLQLELFGY